MIHRGIASFGLDYGHCPPWLFDRVVKLGREMTHALVLEYGPDEFIKRIADPAWFQSLGTVLAFDWNASGLTTILTAALKEAICGEEKDLGIPLHLLIHRTRNIQLAEHNGLGGRQGIFFDSAVTQISAISPPANRTLLVSQRFNLLVDKGNARGISRRQGGRHILL